MRLWDHCNAGQLKIILEHLQHFYSGEKDAEAILHLMLHPPMDKHYHLWGALWRMGPIVDGVIHRLTWTGHSSVDRDALPYVVFRKSGYECITTSVITTLYPCWREAMGSMRDGMWAISLAVVFATDLKFSAVGCLCHVDIGQHLFYSPPKQYGGLESGDWVKWGRDDWDGRTGAGAGKISPGDVEAGESGKWVGAGEDEI